MDRLKCHPCGRVIAYHSRRRRELSSLLPSASAYLPSRDSSSPAERRAIAQEETKVAAQMGLAQSAPLGLSSVANSPNPRNKRGSGGITSRARLRVRDAAAVLEARNPKGTMALLTLTVPPGLEEGSASKWARICKHMLKQLTRDLKAAGLDGEIVYVSEYQESREEKYGKPVLHLHMLFSARKKRGHWAYEPKHYRDRWSDCLSAVLGDVARKAGYESSENIEAVRKSCSAYLGKYMSKGTTVPGRSEGGPAPKAHPSSWHGLSRNLLRAVVRGIRCWSGRSASARLSFLLDNPQIHLRFNRWVSIQGGEDRRIFIAWYGDLVDPAHAVFA